MQQASTARPLGLHPCTPILTRLRSSSGRRHQLTLPELIHAVPRLAQVLSCDAIRNLLATSSTLRRQMHEHVTQITIIIREDNTFGRVTMTHVMALICGWWPALQSWRISGRFSTNFPLNSRKVDMDAIAMLVKGDLLQLKYLHIARAKVTAPFMEELSKGQWPNLSSFSMTHSGLNTARLQALSTVQWGKITLLNLSYNNLDAAAIQILTSISLPNLAELALSGSFLDTRAVEGLRLGQWPHLYSLFLAGAEICKESLATLLQGKWPCLSDLDISDSSGCVDMAAVALLTQANLSCMRDLNLTRNKLEVGVISELVQGNWTQLQRLHLDETGLGPAGVSKLVQGKWPVLQDLMLYGNLLSLAALQKLTRGKWPQLRSMYLTLDLDDSKLVLWLVSKNNATEQALLSNYLAPSSRPREWGLTLGALGKVPAPAVLQAAYPCLTCISVSTSNEFAW